MAHVPGQAPAHEPPGEAADRAAYEAELQRITTGELLLQASASLINVAAMRMGLTGAEAATRDLEQARDAIDAVRAILPVLERRGPAAQLRPLRDALSQLQLAYAHETQGGAGAAPGATEQAPGGGATAPGAGGEPAGAEGAEAEPARGAREPVAAPDESGAARGSDDPGQRRPGADPRRPGPAESTGRLWVPGRH